MDRLAIRTTLAGLLTAVAGAAMACEYTAGQTKFLEYATCRYGEEQIVVVNLPENSSWQRCIYLAEAFRPEKLLAVTRLEDSKEVLSITDRAAIGNASYLAKPRCDAALAASKNVAYSGSE